MGFQSFIFLQAEMNLLHFPEGMQIAFLHHMFPPPEKTSFLKPALFVETMPLIWSNRFCAAVNILQRYYSEQKKY